MKNVKKLFRSGILALSLLAVGLPVVFAAGGTDAGTTTTDTTTPDAATTQTQPAQQQQQDDGFDWGLLGLLGLIGLAGLRGGNKDRTTVVDGTRK